MFLAFGIPRVLLMILAIMRAEPWYDHGFSLDAVEFFSGQAAVTSGMLERGLRAMPYDILNDHVYQDICSSWGFVAALQALRMMVPCQALAWLGTVCSTWIFMSRNSTMRTHASPRGDRSRRCVLRGNRQAARTAIVMCWCYARMLGFIVEQPATSVLWLHPAMRHVQAVAKALKFRWHMVSTYMFAFNGEHLKKTELVSNESFTHHLHRNHPGKKASSSARGAATALTSVRRDGKKQCSGTQALKATQTYTVEFGREVATAFAEFRTFYDDCGCTRGDDLLQIRTEDDGGPWQDAGLEGVLQVLRVRHCR